MDQDKQAMVRVNLHTGELEVRGSEEFVERMLPTARAIVEMKINALPASPPTLPPQSERLPAGHGSALSLSDFIREKGLTRATSGEDAMTAFLYYLIKEQRAESGTKDQILALFEQAGLPKPNNAASTLSNLKARRGFLQSGGRGTYKLTVQGENFVAHQMGAANG
jgi:hypothetical protein